MLPLVIFVRTRVWHTMVRTRVRTMVRTMVPWYVRTYVPRVQAHMLARIVVEIRAADIAVELEL